MTPIVWRMNHDGYPVSVYCMNPDYDMGSDYRLRFLKKLGVKVGCIYDDFDQQLGMLHRVMRLISRASFAIGRKLDSPTPLSISLTELQQRFQKKGIGFYKRSRKKFYDAVWAQDILEQTGAQVLCFDWVAPRRYVVDTLMHAAEKMSIPKLSLPHGVFVYTNESVKIGSEDDERYFQKFSRYDYIAVQNDLFKNVIATSGISREKILVLGSARYCNEWMVQNKKILPRKRKSNEKRIEKFRVVFMTTRPNYRVHVDRMLKTFDILSQLDDIEVVIKPHTRSGEEAKIYEGLPLSNVSDLSSVELCEWADVLLVIGSSILIETLIQHKPVLYLKYLHENITLYEELEACWTIHDESELKDALLSLQFNEADVPYTEENSNRFLSEIIYGGRDERDVLGDYEEFIVSHAGK